MPKAICNIFQTSQFRFCASYSRDASLLSMVKRYLIIPYTRIQMPIVFLWNHSISKIHEKKTYAIPTSINKNSSTLTGTALHATISRVNIIVKISHKSFDFLVLMGSVFHVWMFQKEILCKKPVALLNQCLNLLRITALSKRIRTSQKKQENGFFHAPIIPPAPRFEINKFMLFNPLF